MMGKNLSLSRMHCLLYKLLFVMSAAGKLPEAHSAEFIFVQLLLADEALEAFEVSEQSRMAAQFVDVSIRDGLPTDVTSII